MAAVRDPTRTQDYAAPRGREDARSPAPAEDAPPAHGTRRGVGHDERRPPPGVLPKLVRRVDKALVLGLAIEDALVRATLARGLVRAGCDVHIACSASEVTSLSEAPDVAIVDFDADDAPSIFGSFQDASPGLPVIALSADPEKVRRALQLVRLCPFEVLPRRTSVADVLEAVGRLRG